MSSTYITPFSKTKNNKKSVKNAIYYNFGLPAIGTCRNAPDSCKKGVIHSKPVCFAVRPTTNWPFVEKVSKSKKVIVYINSMLIYIYLLIRIKINL